MRTPLLTYMCLSLPGSDSQTRQACPRGCGLCTGDLRPVVARNREREKWPGHSGDCPSSPRIGLCILDFPLTPTHLCCMAQVHWSQWSPTAGYRVSLMISGSHGGAQAGTLCTPLQPCQLSSPIAFLPARSSGPLWVNFCSPTVLLGSRCAHEILGCQSPFGEAAQTHLQASYSMRFGGFLWRWNFSFSGEGGSVLRTRKLMLHLEESLHENRPVLFLGWLRLSEEAF